MGISDRAVGFEVVWGGIFLGKAARAVMVKSSQGLIFSSSMCKLKLADKPAVCC